MPFISVIVPVYNAEKSIERCVKSITGQEFDDMEVLLIDDGSGDNSGVLCDKLAESDNRVSTKKPMDSNSTICDDNNLLE